MKEVVKCQKNSVFFGRKRKRRRRRQTVARVSSATEVLQHNNFLQEASALGMTKAARSGKKRRARARVFQRCSISKFRQVQQQQQKKKK